MESHDDQFLPYVNHSVQFVIMKSSKVKREIKIQLFPFESIFNSASNHLLRQMLKMWLMVWCCCYLCMRLHEMMSIQITGLSKWLRIYILHLTWRQMGSCWSCMKGRMKKLTSIHKKNYIFLHIDICGAG